MEATIPESLAPTLGEKTFASASAEGLELVDLGAPVLADVDRIVAALDPVADGAMTVIAQPDVPRNLTVTVVDANNSSSGNGLITGTDFFGNEVTETFSWAAAGTIVLTKLFATVASVVLSGVAGAAAGDTLSVGVGDKLALPKKIVNATAIKYASLGAVPDAAPVIVTGDLSSVDLSGGTYDGSKVVKVGYHPGG